MLNLFKRSTTKHEGHVAGGCGCGSHPAPATEAAAQAVEGCCSGHGAKAMEERPVDSDREHASHHADGSCCGGHSATAPAHRRAVRERTG